jgi:hypothetical protein
MLLVKYIHEQVPMCHHGRLLSKIATMLFIDALPTGGYPRP